jgi:hypothetical protein
LTAGKTSVLSNGAAGEPVANRPRNVRQLDEER